MSKKQAAVKVFDSAAFLSNCSTRPGVYRMYDAGDKILYVGKARDLKARLKSYFAKTTASLKTAALVAKIARIETIVTASEVEALLLEQSLIKKLSPPYNILLRDDKTYPYIKVSVDQPFPKATLHRGSHNDKARYFGPYPGVGSVREVLSLLEKNFQLRNCSDTFFRNRTRPCLQYQIGRCTAPCVGLVTPEEYREQVNQAIAFLEGKDDALVKRLQGQMEQASAKLEFERAAELRDRLAAIQEIRQQQYVDTTQGDIDAIALAVRHGVVVISLLMVRNGRVLGHRSIYPKVPVVSEPQTILTAFIEQHYLAGDNTLLGVNEILLDREPSDASLLSEALQAAHNRTIRLAWRVRGERLGFVRLAKNNALNAVRQRLSQSDNVRQRFEALDELLKVEDPIQRIECFDISHTSGAQAVASCVVALREEGMASRYYRKFNVSPPIGGDDYAAQHEAIGRRLKRLSSEASPLPDVLLVDGGKGQVSRIVELLDELNLPDKMLLVGISEGAGKKKNNNVLHFSDGRQLYPEADNPGFLLLQQIRDEAHRFAITQHRAKRAKQLTHSKLEDVPGIGPKRRRKLLQHFGGLKGISNASIEAISQVEGISHELATEVYRHFHGD